jgi:hypothetical protein
MVDQSAQHGPRVDDAMEHEAENEVREAPGSARGHREVLARSELARFVRPSTLPADAARLVEAATEEGATDAVLEELGRLPAGVAFASFGEIWAALGHEMEHRPEAEVEEEAEREPEPEPGPEPAPGPAGPVAFAIGVLRAGLGLLDGALAIVQRAVSRSR